MKKASLSQAEAMAFCLLFGPTHTAHHQTEDAEAHDWFVRDNENETTHYTFEDCLSQLVDERDGSVLWGDQFGETP
jgi:hypothetical protein